MNDNMTEGGAKIALGRVEQAAGEALGDGELQASGVLRQARGHVQEVAGSVQETLEQAVDQAKAAVSTATRAYGRASHAADDLAQRVGEQPFVALGLAGAVGLLVGLLIAGRGPKIVYVRPKG